MIRDIYTIWLREITRFRRNLPSLISQLIFPLAMIVLIAVPIGSIVPDDFLAQRLPRFQTGAAGTYVDFLASGFLVLMMAASAFGGGINLTEERKSGFLREIIVAPVARSSIILGKIAARISISSIQTGLILAALIAFTNVGIRSPLLMLVSIILIAFLFVSVGLILAGLLMDFESFGIVTGFVMMPVYFLSGVFLPISVLPRALRVVAGANPLSYGVDLFRYSVTGVNEYTVLTNLLVLGFAAVAGFIAATAIFDRQLRG